MSEASSTKNLSFGQRVARFFAALVRLVLWTLFLLLILGGLAVLIAWGIPYVDRNIIQPLEDTRARLAQLETAHTELEARLRADEEMLQSLQDQLNAVTWAQQDITRELSAMKAQLDALTGLQSGLQAEVDDLQAQVAALENAVAQMEQMSRELERLGQDAAAVQHQGTLNRALLHLVQARMALAQEDWRLAQEEIGRAAGALAVLQEQTTDPAALDALEEAQTRLRLAYSKALTAPEIAARDLDVVWTLLQEAFPPPGAAAMGAMSPTFRVSPAVEGTPTSTPTPTPTPSP